MSFTDDHFPLEMTDSFKQKSSIFFVGAGVSIEAGLPSWSELIKDLIDLASKQPWCRPDKVDEYKKLLSSDSNFLLLAEELKSELGSLFYDYMESTFGRPDIEPTVTMESILGFNTNIILTSNYDRLIENTFARIHGYSPPTFTYSQSREIANNYWKQKFFVLKAHGDAFSDVQGIILSQRDYRKTLYRELGYKSILQSIFSTKSVFFVGTSMTDPEFNLLLDYLHESYSGGGPTHYLLISDEKANPIIQRRFFEDFKIQTITYKNRSGNHSEINEYLNILKKKID
ncbi:SIR2 family protein [Parapedobacter koreensis]|uniref:SIR2-like domain-containing protein n=1 Tax=Parapedobacter koreensis TaxID=332977 RepID=A0A1H7Q0R0_9SPHI|nr:SIR2 family protein [Parapedobacter koreensis]SEL41399.1 SIR2-like domain-containing protein [Parapedobacter koreensis]